MFYSNSLNLIQVGGGTQVKQGDLGSRFSYKLANEKEQELDVFDKEVAHINLVLDDKIVFTTTATVDNSTVTFNIDKAIPVGLYFLEIKIRDYIFPSDKQTIIFVQSGAVAYDLKELVPNYDTNMAIAGILSDLSQKGIDISDLNRQLAQKANKDEVTNVMTPKGNIAYASLPMTGNSVGWYYYCPDGDGIHGAGNYVWNGTSWYFGGTGDEGYNLLKSDLVESVGQINKQYIDKDTFNNGHWWGYDSGTHNYGLNENQYFDCLQVQNLKAGQYKLSKNDGRYNAFAVNILTNKAYPIEDYHVSELETDKYFVLNVPFDFNFLLTVESYKRHDYMLCDNEYPNSYVYGIFGLNLKNTALEKTLKNYNKNNVFYCGVSRQFTKLKDAIEEATKYMDSIVYVDNGTYDLVEEFGTTYLDSYNGTDNIGLVLKNRVKVVFSSGAKVVFDYQGTNEKVHEYFSPFNSGVYGFTLENAYVESRNCRYSVHDERAHFTDSYHNVYKRCTFIHDSSNASGWHASQAIGGGLGKYGDILIEDCYCKSVSNDDTISYHSTTISEEGNNAKSKIVVKGTYTTGTLDFIQLGNSNQKTPIFVHNCNLRIEPKLEKYGSVDTMELTSWGNTIRSQS